MSEKRFKKMDTIIDPFPIWDTVEEKGYNCTDTLDLLVDLLNEQQATIEELERKVKKYEKIGEEQLKQIIELQDELRECRARPTLATDERGLIMGEQRFTIQKASGMYLHLPIFDNGVEMADGDVCILLNEQQDTIFKLQDLCGKSDGENAKLRLKNKELQEEIKLLKPTNVEQYEQIVQLQEENEQLRQQQQRLYNYFRDYLEDEMSAENFGEMWDTVKVDERWNDE